MTDSSPSIIRTLVFLLWGPLVWGVQFTLSYGGHTLLCAQGVAPGASRLLMAVLALLALISIAPVAFRCQAVFALLSLVAVPWTAAGVLFLQACVVGR